jgi:hypothetical protein
LPGHKGYDLCADYSSDIFAKLKLTPLFAPSFFQDFQIEFNEITGPDCFVNINGSKTVLKIGTDYSFRGFTGSGQVESEIVFCGYGMYQPDDGYNDYAGVDVTGKTVMIFKQNPTWKITGINWSGSNIRYKVNIAKERGARAVIFVNSPSSGRTKPIASMMDGPEKHIADVPAIEMSTDWANKILSKQGYSLEKLQAKIDTLQIAHSFSTKITAGISVQAKYNPNAMTKNIVAIIPGTDPVLKNEYIIISGHLDHVGFQGDSLYYPGANDDASGSALVLEVANMWKKSKIKPARTVVFALFACEEHGLDGARYLANNFPADTNNIVAILNADCAAFGDSLMIGGGKSAPVMWNIAQTFGKGFPLSQRTWHGGGVDAQPFFEKGVPALYFVTVNSYTHLHLPTDNPETLNANMLELAAEIMFQTSVKIADKSYTKETITGQ